MPRALIGCECSGMIRRALRARGWDAWSCDIKPAEDGDPHHIQDDVLKHLRDNWTLAIFHPVCKYLTNSANRWLYEDREEMTAAERWKRLEQGAAFYMACRDAPIEYIATENPVMSRHAKAIIQPRNRQVIQPHWFGDPFFKATGFELKNLPPLERTHWMELPKPGTLEHRAWSKVHRMPPGPNRETERSRTYPGVAEAIAQQWGGYVMEQLQQERKVA